VSYDALFSDFSDDPEFVRFLKRKLKIYGDNGNAPVSRTQLQSVYKQALRLKNLKKLEIIDKIISPFTTKDIIGKNDTLQTVDLIAKDAGGNRILPGSREEFDQFQKKLRRNPIFDRGIYSTDSQTGEITDLAFIIRFSSTSTISKQDEVSREVLDIKDSYKHLRIIAQGQPLIYAWINDYIRKDLFNLVPLALLVVTCILFLNFRTFRGVVMPVVTLVLALIWVLGLMGLLGFKITQLSTSLPPLILLYRLGS
jgi:predicted RND superfamily exporter protein